MSDCVDAFLEENPDLLPALEREVSVRRKEGRSYTKTYLRYLIGLVEILSRSDKGSSKIGRKLIAELQRPANPWDQIADLDALTLVNLAGVLRRLARSPLDRAQAIDVLERAVRLAASNESPDDGEVIRLRRRLAGWHKSDFRYEQAAAIYREIYADARGELENEVRADLAQCLVRCQGREEREALLELKLNRELARGEERRARLTAAELDRWRSNAESERLFWRISDLLLWLQPAEDGSGEPETAGRQLGSAMEERFRQLGYRVEHSERSFGERMLASIEATSENFGDPDNSSYVIGVSCAFADNRSGVNLDFGVCAVLLEIARLIAGTPAERHVRFIVLNRQVSTQLPTIERFELTMHWLAEATGPVVVLSDSDGVHESPFGQTTDPIEMIDVHRLVLQVRALVGALSVISRGIDRLPRRR